MELSQFINMADLSSKTEIEKVKLMTFYDNFVKQQSDFNLNEIFDLLQSVGHHISNHSRLKSYLLKSKDFKFEKMLTNQYKKK